MRTSTFLWRGGSEGGGSGSDSNRSGGCRRLCLFSKKKRILNALGIATTWCVSSTVRRKLATPSSWCLGEFRCALSTSSWLWRGKLLREQFRCALSTRSWLWGGELLRELTTNYCSTTTSGNNLSFLLLFFLLYRHYT